MSATEETTADETTLLPAEPRPRTVLARLAPRRAHCIGFACGFLLAAVMVAGIVVVVLPAMTAGGGGSAPAMPSRPPAPTALNATATCDSVDLRWEVPDLRGRRLVRFELQTDRADGRTLATEIQCAATEILARCKLTGLPPDASVRWRVRATSTACCDSLGNLLAGDWSAVANVSTLPIQPPARPRQPRLLLVSTEFAVLGWDAPTACLMDTVTVHARIAACGGDSEAAIAWCCDDHTLNWTSTSLRAQTATTANVIGLRAGQHYCVQLYASNMKGARSNWTDPLPFRTDRATATTPAQPMPVDVPVRGYASLTVAWRPPVDDGGSMIVGYAVTAYQVDNTSLGLDADDATPTTAACQGDFAARRCVLKALSAGERYAVRVRAMNSQGASPWSAPNYTRTLHADRPGGPGQPAISADDPQALVWAPAKPHGDPVIRYDVVMDDWWSNSTLLREVARLENGSCSASLDVRSLPRPPPLYQQRLLPDTTYRVRVAAANARGQSAWSPAGTFRSPATGACGSRADLPIFRDRRSSLKQSIQTAIIDCALASNKTGCVVQRLQQAVGMSARCAGCWASEGLCTLKHCALPCMAPSSTACQKCSESQCFPQAVRCTGLPRWAFPP